jgi:hypothetical protein
MFVQHKHKKIFFMTCLRFCEMLVMAGEIKISIQIKKNIYCNMPRNHSHNVMEEYAFRIFDNLILSI